MDSGTSTPLPWDVLRHTEGDIPWATIEQFAAAAATDGEVLEGLLDLYDEFEEVDDERESFECLYVPAILAMAAPRLSDADRDRAARFLLRSLTFAGDEEDEFMEDVLTTAIGAFGPKVVLPLVVEFMPKDYQPWNLVFDLWKLASIARKTHEPELREPIITLCTEALEKAERGLAKIGCVDYAGFVLARMRHMESRPLIERLYEKTELGELGEYLQLMDGKWKPSYDEDEWDKPVAQWLEENWKHLRQCYEDGDGTEYEDGDEQNEAAERRADELARGYGEFLEHLPLSQGSRNAAESIANSLLYYAWAYEGAKPEDLTIPVLREVLLELFPRKISAGREYYEAVGSVVEMFLHWLGTKGILKDADPLENAVSDWREEIVARGMDPGCWGMAKSFAMAALERGIDPRDKEGMDRFMLEYNQQIIQRRNQVGRYEPVEDSFEPVTAPIVNVDAKVGRNEPCPCGSGKKHKKCCGR